MYDIGNLPTEIVLGNQRESGVALLEFDMTEWLNVWPEMGFAISYNATGKPFPVSGVSRDGNVLTWVVGDDCTQYTGYGTIVIDGMMGNVVKCSGYINALVYPGHAASQNPPKPISNWLLEAALKWGTAHVTITTLEPDQPATANVTQDHLGTHLHLGVPRGLQGNIGLTGATTFHVKYSAVNPTSDEDLTDTPSAWMGVYTGDATMPPTDYTAYRWFKIEGPQGPEGTGIAGPPGPPSTVCGVENVEGDIPLKGSDIPVSAEDPTKIDAALAEKVSAQWITVELPAEAWEGAEAPYTQTVAVEGMQETHRLTMDIVQDDDMETRIAQRDAYSYIVLLNPGTDEVTFICDEGKPDVDLTVQLEVKR